MTDTVKRLVHLKGQVLAKTLWIVDKLGFVLLGIGVYALVGAAADGFPLAAQIAVLASVFVPLALLIRWLSKAPDDTLAPVRRHGLTAPIAFVTGLWLAALGWCAGLALVLDQRGVVAFRVAGSGEPVGSAGQVADLLVWHSFEQIPAVGVNDTLNWDEPLDYGSGAGFVVLAFKLLILLPLVPVFLAAWRHRRPPAD